MTQEKVGGLFEEYKGQIYRLCMHLTKNQPDADDLFQDTFVAAFQKHGYIDESKNPKSYLYRMCLNLWKTENRKRKTVPLAYEPDRKEEDPEETVIMAEQKRIIAQAVESLKEKYRIPVYLFYTADMSVMEIAQIIKIPEGTVKSRLHKARYILRERLVKNDERYTD